MKFRSAVSAALSGSVLMLAGPAIAGTGPTAAADEGCGGPPAISLWYDSDQYGSYTKVSFSKGGSCGVPARAMSATVRCADTNVIVYDESVPDLNDAPFSTPTGSLPVACGSFVAVASVSVPAPSDIGAVSYQASWRWNNGDYPA